MVKIAATAMFATVTLMTILTAAVSGVVSAVLGPGTTAASSPPSPTALADIPGNYLTLYQHAAPSCPGLDWSVLAGIGKVETNHGRLNAPGVHTGENSAGAAGPMQFLQPTFQSITRKHPPPPGGVQPPSRYNPHDAIYTAAGYLCDGGARDNHDLHAAIFQYNHADWYVHKVLTQATAYRSAQQIPSTPGTWVVPVDGRCSSGFGARNGEFHNGQDIAVPIGAPIVAASSGTVIDSGPAGGYGLWVRIQHPDGVVSTYGHNDRNRVQPGQPVQVGQPIADVGNRGESTGPHLHFQIEHASEPTDPSRFYQQRSLTLCR